MVALFTAAEYQMVEAYLIDYLTAFLVYADRDL